MADILKPAFRATSGLDAAGEKVINVAKADYNVLDDGVNVEFFIDENTIQAYDETRGYKKGFAVIHDQRIWVSQRDIDAPAGTFTPGYWTATRTDPKWITVASPTRQLASGEYIAVDSAASFTTFTLPPNPTDGDTVVIKDIGGRVGYNEIKVQSSSAPGGGNQKIVRFGNQFTETLITKPFSYNMIIFANRLWHFWEAGNEERGIRVEPNMAQFQSQAGDNVLRRYTSGAVIKFTLPKYANQGDMIKTVDIDGLGSKFHLIVETFDASSALGKPGQHSMEFRTSGDGFFVYNSTEKLWYVWDGDRQTRLRVIRDDVELLANESVIVFGPNNTTPQTINITLPTSVAQGDTIKIALNYLRKAQTVNIKAAVGDKIASSVQLLQFPKRSEYPPDTEWVLNDVLTFNGNLSYTPVIELSYIEDSTTDAKYWVVAQNVPTVERVDSKDDLTRARLGVIALASQTQANVDHENNPEKELAITPQTLANRVATESRRGIARIATTAQVNQNTGFAFQDDLIISPKKLNERTATETRRGVAEIATQQETDAGVDDTTIITPKKLQTRQGTETLSGIVKYVSTTGTTPATSRATVGTNVYNKNTTTLVISPKALDQYKANYENQGAVYLATAPEVNAGTTNPGFQNAVVTPEMLHQRVALDSRTGLIEIATQAETDTGTDYTRAVTPKTLNDRKATETLTGIARIGTQVEFDAGVLDNVISTPLKVKTRFNDTARTSVSAASGLIESGTLWNHYTLDIREASNTQRGTARLATQTEVNTGTDDKTIITPLKLQAKKATENAEGIIQLATQAEVIDGTVSNKAFSPKHYKYIVQQEKSWEATSARRGYVKLTTGTATWEGDDTNGSVANLAKFEDNGFAISPLQMNTALTHYLPIKGKAFDSDKLDGFDSTQFIRRDIAQDINANMTFKQPVRIENTLAVTGAVNLSGSVISNNTTLTGSTTVNSNSTMGALNYIEFTSESQGAGTWNSQHNSNVKAPVFLNITTGPGSSKYVPIVKQRYKTGTFSFGTLINESEASPDEGSFVLHYIDEAQTQRRWTFRRDGSLLLSAGDLTLYNGNATINGGLSVTKASGITTTGLVASSSSRFDGSVAINNTLTVRDPLTANGGLTVNSRIRSQGTKPADLYSRKPNADNTGFWSVDVNDSATYNQFPGYFKMVEKTNEVTGLPYLVRGEEVKSPGTLTQFGNTLNSLYQDWITYPNTADGSTTRWTRTWQQNKNAWSGFVQVFDGGNPPQPSDIGALPSDNASMSNLTIRDWLRIGNVRMVPDPVTRSVKFEWIDTP
ncbi:long tail fiber proximal subunit [Escherichia phage AnYang]|uniref:Long tail fiber proximal subunit n=1 Tax=Escherichia phage AnYang TaxID=2499909 RepID=A0A410T4Y7_9CAUD|nr:tail fiber protein proximal subunit [Escherichia phage AnYang]QAU03689.1 long tail fiber proximal subunit [Escherichia phage AnYang]